MRATAKVRRISSKVGESESPAEERAEGYSEAGERKPARSKGKLVHMARTAAEQKQYDSPMAVGRAKGKTKNYPYGLSIDLDEGGLAKLGIKDLPAHGSTVHLHAKARVDNTNVSTQDNGTPQRSARLQITHLHVAAQPNPSASSSVKTQLMLKSVKTPDRS